MLKHPLVRTAPISVPQNSPIQRRTLDGSTGPVETDNARFKDFATKDPLDHRAKVSQDSMAELEAGRRLERIMADSPISNYKPSNWRLDSTSSSEEDSEEASAEEALSVTEAEEPRATDSNIQQSLLEASAYPPGKSPTSPSTLHTLDLTISLTTPSWTLSFNSPNSLLQQHMLQQLPTLLRSLQLTQLYSQFSS